DDPDVAAMEALARSRPAPAVAAQLGFALAKAHEDLGDIDAAWAHLARANAGVRERLAHDVADDLAAFQALAAAFGADRLSGARRTDPAEGPIPIFIVGMPRSGTSLVEQILACHDAVAAGGEREDLRRLVGAKDPATWSDDHLATLGAAYRHAVAPLAGGRRFITDKMPVNARFVGLIALALPEARIIHCRRDPVDTCLACFK
ncbi:MAG: sulfotransferase, partial [Phycisphaerales bacterium]|nr:sulfotransferase [Phycisphaerales bacterium]